MITTYLRTGKIHYAWILLTACCIIQLALQGVFNYCSGIFYVPVSESLGVTVGKFSVSSTIYALTMGLFGPIAGKLFSRRYMGLQMAGATSIMCVSLMLLSLANYVWQWYLAMAVIGACGSFLLIIPIPLLINSWFDKHTGIVLSITAAFAGISGAIVSPIGAQMILSFGWRKAYMFLGLISAILAVPVILLFITSSPAQVGMLPYGFDKNSGDMQHVTVTPVEKKRFKLDNKTLYVLLLSAFLSFFKSYYNHFSAFAASIGLQELEGAGLMSLIMIGTVFLRLVLGVLNDRVGINNTMNLSLLIIAMSLLCLSFFYKTRLIMMVATFAMGIGPAMMSVLPPLITGAVCDRENYRDVFPLAVMASTFSSALSNSLIGFTYDAFNSYVPVMLFGIVLTAFAFFLGKKAHIA